MKSVLIHIQKLFCKHDLVPIYTYDQHTQKMHCFKCGSRMIVNSKYASICRLDKTSEKAYDQLQNDLQLFYSNFRNDQ